ncbi:hypothetical protein Aph02nite_89420 [Actinoplanes philippinensis]|nr:hypothetical protein Aph02nite_89420 [Actinoplanes philippinensis]
MVSDGSADAHSSARRAWLARTSALHGVRLGGGQVDPGVREVGQAARVVGVAVGEHDVPYRRGVVTQTPHLP